jgi:hypothetical protein
VGKNKIQAPQQGQIGQKSLVKICVDKQPSQALNSGFFLGSNVYWLLHHPHFICFNLPGALHYRNEISRYQRPLPPLSPSFVLLPILGFSSSPPN